VEIPLPTSDSIAGSPSGWGSGAFVHLEWCYNSDCGYFGTTNLAPSKTLSGFLVNDTSSSALTSVQWTVYAEGGTYNGANNIGNSSNPGFTGVPTPTTPLPATLPLFATGLAALCLLGWHTKRKARDIFELIERHNMSSAICDGISGIVIALTTLTGTLFFVTTISAMPQGSAT
jgi:hypothetical protein